MPLDSGERVLAWARDEQTGSHVLATTHHLALVGPDDALGWRRPWHEVEAGTWQGESSLLTVTWVDHGAPSQWHITEPSMIQQTLRERVQASVVLADEFRTAGAPHGACRHPPGPRHGSHRRAGHRAAREPASTTLRWPRRLPDTSPDCAPRSVAEGPEQARDPI